MHKRTENYLVSASRTRWLLVAAASGSLLSGALASGCGSDSGGGGAGGESTSSSSASSSSGPSAACAAPADCPDTGNECVVRTCTNSKCGTANAAQGTALAEQIDGDCKRAVCDGNGGKTSINDDADLKDDGKQCTKDVCKAGVLAHDALPQGSTCSESSGKLCDAVGACVSCVGDTDCAVGVCSQGKCVAPRCADQVKNDDETDVDCGGSSCPPCSATKTCAGSADCASSICAVGTCATGEPILTAISAAGHDRFFGVTFDKQGNIFAVGVAAPTTDATADFSTIVAKFTPQGVLDTTFGEGGVAKKNLTIGTNGELARGVVVQSTGKIVVSATVDHAGAADARDRDVALARFNTNGTLDTTFGDQGVRIVDLSPGQLVGASFLADSAWGLAVYPDDRLVMTGGMVRPGGTDTDYAMVRFTADGALDPAFGDNGVIHVDVNNANASARGIALLPDGSLYGAGYMDVAGAGTPVVYKADSTGKLDATFGVGGVFNQVVLAAQTEAYYVVPQGDKLVTTGYGRASTTESLDWLSMRLLSNGTLDPTYGDKGVARIDVAGFNDQSRHLLVLPDNRVVLSGGGRPSANEVDGAIGVLTPDGKPDLTFAPKGVKLFDLGGPNDFLWSLALSPSKNYIAVAGIKGAPTGGQANDDSALLLVPIK